MAQRMVSVGPFSIFFTNVNTEMKLPGHSHFATVTLHFGIPLGATRGFPAFADTYAEIQDALKEETATPFRDSTNEIVATRLWNRFRPWAPPAAMRWGGAWYLKKLELAVRGVPDKIGHADGFTVYTVEVEEE